MQPFAEKRHLILQKPDAQDTQADRERLLQAFLPEQVQITLPALQSLYPCLADAGYDVTVTLCPGADGMDIVRVEQGNTTGKLYGFALDIGSTTLQLALVDMKSGETICEFGAKNSQIALGSDILARIFAIKEDKNQLKVLQQMVIGDICALAERCCEAGKVPLQDISALCVGGNTTMIHFFLGCDPWLVFQSPYAPCFYAPGIFHAWELGLPLQCNVFCMPAVANYLGGDITSGLLMTDMTEREGLSMFLDIGTNGELALGCKDFLLVGAGAAGPALEGAVSKSGMLAEDGAVCRVRIGEDNQLKLTVLGGGKPKGICGSGLLDLIAQGYLAGWINGDGTLNADATPAIRTVWVEEKNENIPAIVYATGEAGPLYITQDDIAEFIRCKAAAHTMVATMLDECQVDISQIEKFYLAGGFGTHYDLESAITVGLYPDIPREKFVILGNSSLAGAKRLLCDRSCLEKLGKICMMATYVQFGEMEKFLENMVAAQFLPHTNAALYPSVHRRK